MLLHLLAYSRPAPHDPATPTDTATLPPEQSVECTLHTHRILSCRNYTLCQWLANGVRVTPNNTESLGVLTYSSDKVHSINVTCSLMLDEAWIACRCQVDGSHPVTIHTNVTLHVVSQVATSNLTTTNESSDATTLQTTLQTDIHNDFNDLTTLESGASTAETANGFLPLNSQKTLFIFSLLPLFAWFYS